MHAVEQAIRNFSNSNNLAFNYHLRDVRNHHRLHDEHVLAIYGEHVPKNELDIYERERCEFPAWWYVEP